MRGRPPRAAVRPFFKRAFRRLALDRAYFAYYGVSQMSTPPRGGRGRGRRTDVAQERTEVRERLESADCVPLALAVAQMRGDMALVEEIAPYVRGPWDYSESIPEETKVRIRDAAAD